MAGIVDVMGAPSAGENDFERKVRESEQVLLRSVAAGKRPLFERWWWFLLVTAQFWLRLVLWPFRDDHTGSDNVLAGAGVGVLVIGIPLCLWARRRGERKRAAARAAGDEASSRGRQPGLSP